VYGSKGRLRNKVTVPERCWKIVIVLPRGGGPADVNATTRVIAVDMPNKDGIGGTNWRQYLTTVRAIEQVTGLDFFSTLPANLQDALETRPDPTSRMDRDE
jgi:endonuclease G